MIARSGRRKFICVQSRTSRGGVAKPIGALSIDVAAAFSSRLRMINQTTNAPDSLEAIDVRAVDQARMPGITMLAPIRNTNVSSGADAAHDHKMRFDSG